MAKNPNSNIHNDTWMTDAYQRRARSAAACSRPPARTRRRSAARCVRQRGPHRLGLPVAPRGPAGPRVRPEDARLLATYDLPDAPNPPGTKLFQNFTGGGYFFLDAKDRIWSATKTSHLFVLAERDNGHSSSRSPTTTSPRCSTGDERVSSALPDFQGRIWFVSKKNGKIGVLDTETRKIKAIALDEEIENSFAVDRDGVYIVSDKRMYRFNAGGRKPRVDWKVTYKNSGIHKPSQVDAGTGTTPTILHGGYVAITDNADPMNVVVYRTAAKLPKGQQRRLRGAGLRQGRQRDRELAHHRRPLAVRREQLRLPGPFGTNAGAVDEARLRARRRQRQGHGCKKGVDEHDRARADGRPRSSRPRPA